MQLLDDQARKHGAGREQAEETGFSGVRAVLLATFAACLFVLLWGGVAQASFSGGNGKISFVRNDPGATGDVWSMGSNGSSQMKLSDTVYGDAPDWSADGAKLAFSDLRDLWTTNADGSAEVRLTNDEASDRDPAWFPGGESIVFAREDEGSDPSRQGPYNLYTMAIGADGQPAGAPVRLTNSTQDYTYNRKPAVSPDGSEIAFESNRDGDYEIYVMRAAPESATNQPRKLTNNQTRDYEPDWSPDGSRLVYVRANDVWRMKADGSRKTKLTGRPSVEERSPVWSPNGKKIAFQRFVGGPTGNYEILAIKAAPESSTNRAVNLTENPADDFTPSWQPLP